MAGSALNLQERFRPWHDCGLHFILRDGAVSEPVQAEATPQPVSLEPSNNPDTWPEPWAGYWNRTPHPAYSVWTYWNLSLDLGDHPNDQRRDYLKRIMQTLAWPRGNISFWPFTAPDPQEPCAQLPYFMSGVQAIQAKLVICLGQELPELLAPKALAAHAKETMFFLRGKMFTLVVLPDIHSLMSGNESIFKEVIELLQRFAPLPA